MLDERDLSYRARLIRCATVALLLISVATLSLHSTPVISHAQEVESGPTPPALDDPAPDAVLDDETPRFDWRRTSRVEGYRFEVAADPAFTSVILQSEQSDRDYTLEQPLQSGTYFWRVSAVDVAGEWSAWSEVRSFTIAVDEPEPAEEVTESPTEPAPTDEPAEVVTEEATVEPTQSVEAPAAETPDAASPEATSESEDQAEPSSEPEDESVAVMAAAAGTTSGLTGQYFDRADLTGLALTRIDYKIDFEWSEAPGSGMGWDTFSVRWTGEFYAEKSERYTFSTTSNDGVRLWVNNQLLIDNWTNHWMQVDEGSIQLEAGRWYSIRLEYYENTGLSVIQLRYAAETISERVIPSSRLRTTAATEDAEPRTTTGGCGYQGSRLVSVDSATELDAAIDDARPGDVIQLADGTYTGKFKLTASGTSSSRIVLCGGPGAVVSSPDLSGTTLYLDGADYWTLSGFTVRNGVFNIRLERASFNVMEGLNLGRSGQASVLIRYGSSDNIVRNSYFNDTGRLKAEFGEGVYIGQNHNKWIDGQPDRSDRNQIVGNVFGALVRAEAVDVKEGTSNGVVRGNQFDGSGMTSAVSYVDSWVDIKGNGWLVAGNRGAVIPIYGDGYEVTGSISGWGRNNRFEGNYGDVRVRSGGDGRFGVHVPADLRSAGNVVTCDNEFINVDNYSAPDCSG